jgi:hypothetical protein
VSALHRRSSRQNHGCTRRGTQVRTGQCTRISNLSRWSGQQSGARPAYLLCHRVSQYGPFRVAGNGRLVPPPARLNALSPTAPVARPALAWGQVPLRGPLGSKYKNCQYTFGINFLETNVKDPFGYKAPVNPELIRGKLVKINFAFC